MIGPFLYHEFSLRQAVSFGVGNRLNYTQAMRVEASATLEQLWSQAGGDPTALGRAMLTGAGPILPTDFKIGTAASAVIAATALECSHHL